MVAAAKLRKAQDRILQMRPYSQKLNEIIQNVSRSGVETTANPFAETREVFRVLLVVVSSDRGLCGAFNSNVFKHTRSLIENKYQDTAIGGGLEILPIGKKAFEHFKKRKYQVIDKFYKLFNHLSFDKTIPVVEYVMGAFKAGRFDKVEIIFNEFKNVAAQIIRKEAFLPVQSMVSEETIGNEDYIYEPSLPSIFDELVSKSLKTNFYKAILESNASEHGARMTAMDKASENADELLKELKLSFNRTRQAAITKEILEIVGGAEALS